MKKFGSRSLLDSLRLGHMSSEDHFMLRTNVEKLIKMSVMGEVASPTIRSVYNVSATGKPLVLPGVGGSNI